jgi:uncharacterized protein YegL
MTEPKGKKWPVYFVADESTSMTDDIRKVNEGLTALRDELHRQSDAAGMVMFSIIGFSDDAVCRLEMTDLRDVEGPMPVLAVRGSTSYAAAFNELARRIPLDVRKLKDENYIVLRPGVFFLTDGRPNPDEENQWPAALSALRTMRECPNILSFGIGAAVPATIAQIASKREYAYVAAAGADTGKAIVSFFESLTRSIVNSGQQLARGGSEVVCEKPEGFKIALDPL